MDLINYVKDKTVLEIGCNAGFLALSISPSAKSVSGFDIAPHLIAIAEETKEFLKIDNVKFKTSSFEEFEISEPFDVVLSFANHSTYDGNTKQSIKDYFERCHKACKSDGLLIFESHPPKLEGENFPKVREAIEEFFSIQHESVLTEGTFLDKERTFIVAKKK